MKEFCMIVSCLCMVAIVVMLVIITMCVYDTYKSASKSNYTNPDFIHIHHNLDPSIEKKLRPLQTPIHSDKSPAPESQINMD